VTGRIPAASNGSLRAAVFASATTGEAMVSRVMQSLPRAPIQPLPEPRRQARIAIAANCTFSRMPL
jgi:hypothetical protein